ncbi:MAG: class I SAM-dependent methyltransferase [Candidatus Taylorbacteria bacterium]|nr:class I SAM-dependent methyltransferase [Candidatus Taylorbacteria bacterium]
MKKINPQLTQDFLIDIKNQESKILDIDGIQIQTCKNVFPPQSKFSHSSIELHHVFGDLKNKKVLDIGTGTGIHAIRAAKMGAQKVVAVDINKDAVKCAQDNAQRNGVGEIVEVIESDVFENVPKDKFDLIIANLPITDFPIEGIIESSLYDPEYQIHKRFLEEAKSYVSPEGNIAITHINFKGEDDFSDFEMMIGRYGYRVLSFEEIDAIGYKWRYYKVGV